ncbi:methyltransferase domain-containing protein [Roseomonas terrae]|uniref:Methyltransferase domain-containing protein n=1 Tax=Neoroseomonas terrae TaxID=424799 RepID=A0ABS5EG51_9PROT|nr:methyltransferase domain-containing protein [Neoroseomonas terrae]MBR0649982.1 methyltransferase domain-containing protein [Neoroseomonas terrae]
MTDAIARRSARTDGNFVVPRPSVDLPFTGERMTSVMEGQIEFEHFHRYCLARDLCDGLDVLDVASGEGYGSALLAGVAKSVVGVEIDLASVAHAQSAYGGPTLQFLPGDALALPIGDASVDAVISFETLEHLSDQPRFIREVRRVLRPGGLFIVSTPDRTVYSAPGSEPNPYHVLELTPSELAGLLGASFRNYTMLQQRPLLGSLMAGGTGENWRSFERRSADRIEATAGLSRAHYLVALASDAPLPEIGPSMYADRRRVHEVVQEALSVPSLRHALAAAQSELGAAEARLDDARRADRDELQAARLELDEVRRLHQSALQAARAEIEDARNVQQAALRASRAEIESLRDAHHAELQASDASRARAVTLDRDLEMALKERDSAVGMHAAAAAQAASIANDRDEAQRQLAASEARRAQTEQALNAVWSSTSWRILGPFRRAGRRFPSTARLLRRGLKVVWWTLSMQIGYRYMLWRRHRNAPQAPMPALPMLPGAAAAPLSPDPTPMAAKDLRLAFQTLHGTAAIYFPPVAEPEVSIIIPAYRHLDELLTCLRSISTARQGSPSFEVIVIDDCPEYPVLWAVPRSGGLLGIANEENLGFLLSCNRAASKARGRILCFLNSDTIVTRGWLDHLVRALEETPRAALAGSMLLNQDGTIQDAGWRIAGNGWGHPLGRGTDAQNGAYTHRRAVDCVTGACFCVPRAVWEDLDGFDTAYAPAFYEEFDLAFRAKRKGLKVIYEPASRVVHLGSASYGAERRDALSTINHATFSARFADVLRKQPNDLSDEFTIRHAGPERPTILVIDQDVPVPEQHAGDVTMAGYLRILVDAGWRVVFGPHSGVAAGLPCEALEAIGIEMIRAPQTIAGWLAAHGRHLRQVWISRPHLAIDLLATIRGATNAPIAYYTHDLHFLRMKREADLHDSAEMAEAAERMRSMELDVLRSVDRVLTPSAEEGDMIVRLVPAAKVTTVPPYSYKDHEIRARSAGEFNGLTDVLFVGGFPHPPNVDAAFFIAREVMPLVWRVRPDARLLLVGYAPPPEVQALASDRIVVTGQVPDLAPWFERSRVMLAALRYGAGVKGKVVEAMRAGLPVVTTAVGAEGIGIVPDQEAIVAEDAAGLAAGVLALFDDPARCTRMSAAGAALVARRFSLAAARATVDSLFSVRRCSSCGSTKLAPPPATGDGRESFFCHDCFALARCEALARVILARFARQGETSLPELMAAHPGLRMHELGFVGGIADSLRGLPNYSESEFFSDVPVGTSGPGGVRCEDVTRLTFDDESFDIIVSQDVMEHVPDPVSGFAETARVLRPGGSHFFTVPLDPDLDRSATRATLGPNGVVHVLPPEYHGDPVRSEGALVFTEYGRDLPELVARAGLQLVEHEQGVFGGDSRAPLRVFEAIKPAGPPPG